MENQLNRGLKKRLMYVENKDGDLDGASARIGWVSFSQTGKTVYYRGRELSSTGGRGIRGNFRDHNAGEEYWISGVKRRGTNAHQHAAVKIIIDDDALTEYQKVRQQ